MTLMWLGWMEMKKVARRILLERRAYAILKKKAPRKAEELFQLGCDLVERQAMPKPVDDALLFELEEILRDFPHAPRMEYLEVLTTKNVEALYPLLSRDSNILGRFYFFLDRFTLNSLSAEFGQNEYHHIRSWLDYSHRIASHHWHERLAMSELENEDTSVSIGIICDIKGNPGHFWMMMSESLIAGIVIASAMGKEELLKKLKVLYALHSSGILVLGWDGAGTYYVFARSHDPATLSNPLSS